MRPDRLQSSPLAGVALSQKRRYEAAMSESDKSIHDQLVDARDKIRRELEILISPSSIGGGADNRSVIAALEDELRQIEEQLANH